MARRSRAYRGKQTCGQCRQASATRRVVLGSVSRYLCGPCAAGPAAKSERGASLMVHDHVRSLLSREAAAFVKARLCEAGADKAKADIYVALRTSRLAAGDLPTVKVGLPRIVTRRHRGRDQRYRVPWHEVSAAVREGLAFPVAVRLPVRAVQVKDEVARQLMKADWFYEWEEVVFRDAAEAWVWGAGYGAFKVLRALNLIPGRATKTARRRFGIEWLAEFRRGRTADPATPPTTPATFVRARA